MRFDGRACGVRRDKVWEILRSFSIFWIGKGRGVYKESFR